ncbi:MAG: sigma-54 dependent transcriptional regulator [Syntrophobacteraceae bacterium]|nr:sigma-54 dependent transcriptional regulator [Syntrophobacteraceae bacterium]
MRILAVDDERTALTSLKRILERHGIWDIETCQKGQDAVALIKQEDFDIVLLDILMPEMDGLAVLEAAKPFRPATEFIVLTAVDDLTTAVQAIRLGAYDYMVKPVDNSRLFLTIERAFERKGLRAGFLGMGSCRNSKGISPEFTHIITQNSRMLELLEYAAVMARSTLAILITGESGTGKELLARGAHRASPYGEGPFVAVNVAAVPDNLFESHFFGHRKGAFTGSEHDFKGYFEQADGGTLFLDEIGEVPPHLQTKLLRAIEDKTITPVGSEKSMKVDVRIISSTNADLDRLCREGRFRLDLLYRIKPAHIHLPPLRERNDDIALLADHFLQDTCKRTGIKRKCFTPQALNMLSALKFEGNVRELAQTVEKAVLLAENDHVRPEHLGGKDTCDDSSEGSKAAEGLCSLKENEERHVVRVLELSMRNRVKAAAILGITVRQLQRKIAQIKADPRWAKIANTL